MEGELLRKEPVLISPTAPMRMRCRLCNTERSDGQLPVFELPPTPLANSFSNTALAAQQLPRFPLEVFSCSRCGHHQLGVVASAEAMFSDYAYASGTSESFRKHFAEYAADIRVAYPDVRRIIELGSNDGTMMKALLGLGGMRVVGVEPATNLAQKCVSSDGLHVINEFFTEATVTKHKLSTFDFFVANNVLAHIDDFVGTLNALGRTEARAGVFEVQYLGALLNSGTFDMIYHEHLDYWRVKELVDQLPVQTPWKVVHVGIVPTHGGSLRVWVERSHSKTNLSVLGRSIYEREFRTNWNEEWKLLRSKMDAERKRLWALLGDDKRIAVFGAPAKLTSLLYGLQLTNLNLVYVVDDSPLKQELFTPGTGLAVHAPAFLTQDPPDAVLIGAWNFAEHIMPRVAELVPGKLIVTPFEK